MAACGENDSNPFNNEDTVSEEVSSPTESETKISRSPSSSSYDPWPTLLVSKKPPSFHKKYKSKFSRDPVIIERRNLVNISKLIVKELIETSLKYGRMLDSDHMPLQHFFIVLEHVLRHGLRPKKGLLGPKKELWDILQVVEKLTPEAQDITTSVRDLPTVRTAMGRARAWLRLALMQKKLADYLKILVDHRDDVLADYFEPDALMMSEEANVIEGLLTGLNVIDCNLCVKEEDLDCQQGVIDFSLYLRSSHHLSTDSPDEDLDTTNMTTVLDQKNYIEELNRHLNATVGNLQAKVETLTTTNALMKEDLAIAKNNILQMIEENTNLKAELSETPRPEKTEKVTANPNAEIEIESLKEQLENERKLRAETEKELHLQISLKAEMEVAMKLLEKDIHEKQDTIISLRRQLDDIKTINLEMYRKLQECESSLKHKTELIAKLESKSQAMTETLQKMDEKQLELTRLRSSAEESLRRVVQQNTAQEERKGELEGKLKVEREWRQSMQDTITSERDTINNLQQEIAQLKAVAEKYVELQEEHYRMGQLYQDQELTLQELGTQLSESKLQVSELLEEANATRGASDTVWTRDKEVTHCKACSKEFNLTRRKKYVELQEEHYRMGQLYQDQEYIRADLVLAKHHCRHCGNIFCNSCSDNSMPLPSSAKPVRVCDECYILLVARNSVIH